jgi:hypothetical protein
LPTTRASSMMSCSGLKEFGLSPVDPLGCHAFLSKDSGHGMFPGLPAAEGRMMSKK